MLFPIRTRSPRTNAPGTQRDTSRLSLVKDLGRAERLALIEEIDRTLACRIRDIRLRGDLERLYRAATWRQRSRTVQSWLLWVSIFSAVTCFIDVIQFGGFRWISVLTRAVFIPAVYAAIAYVWSRPRPSWVEGLTLPVTAAAMLIVAQILGVAGGGVIHERYLTGGLFATATALLIFPCSRPWPVVTTVMCLGLYLGFGLTNPNLPTILTLTLVTFYGFVIGCLVPARGVMNVVLAHAFLLRLRVELQADTLEEANARLAVLATTDSLTGIPNRREIEGHLAGVWAAAAEARGSVGVAMIDVDHFKRLNDCLGHAAGDACLVAVSRAIAAAIPSSGFAGRHGGEEFVVILADAAPSALVAVAEGIRAAVAGLALPNPGLGVGCTLSVSVGVAMALPKVGLDGTGQLLLRADAALYAAKAQGRDRVVGAWTIVGDRSEGQDGAPPPSARAA